jgi:hypothetical protein
VFRQRPAEDANRSEERQAQTQDNPFHSGHSVSLKPLHERPDVLVLAPAANQQHQCNENAPCRQACTQRFRT